MAKKFAMDWGKITDQIKKTEKKTYEKDQRLYIPKVGENGTFEATIRFLPQKDLCAVPYVDLYSHSFHIVKNGNKKYYINDCPTTIKGNKCPACEYNNEHWGEYTKKEQTDRKRKHRYYSNILVLRDKQNPENEGKVFIYGFGIKIFEKIDAKMFPNKYDSEDDPMYVYDPCDGNDFKLKIVIKTTSEGNQPNYDQSSFTDIKSAIAKTDDDIQTILDNCYDLAEFNSKDRFKSYGELEESLFRVLGKNVKSPSVKEDDTDTDNAESSAEEGPDLPFDDDTTSDTKEDAPKKENKMSEFAKKLRQNAQK